MKVNPQYNTKESLLALYNKPLLELVFEAATIHREFHDSREVQMASLLSIKTGGCAEDCGYCPQAARYHTDVEAQKLMTVESVLEQARNAKENGSSRLCMGAAWREVRDNRDFDNVVEMVQGVNDLGMEVCCTLGMMNENQAERLKKAGLFAYNHNLDTSPEFYGSIITTRTYQDRLNTLTNVRDSGMKVCAGGIVGMGENLRDRVGLLQQLANMPQHPESVPINMLVKVEGTPLDQVEDLEPFDFIRTIAVARVLMPQSHVRLSAGRESMNEQMQAMCFFAGANSIFYGERLLTTDNPAAEKDRALFVKLGIRPEKRQDVSDEAHRGAIEQAIENASSEHMFVDASL